MKRRLFKTMVALLAIAAATAGPAWGQNANPDVTLDFTINTWGLPTSNTMATESYTDGTYSITLSATYAYKFTSGYLLLGKSGSYLQLPAFSSPVEKIEVVGKSGASGNVNQNIYVGGTAVSTQTTGAAGTNTYVINADYRAAGNIYTLKVENAFNTQITYVKVYYVSSGGGSGSETPTPGQNANVSWVLTPYGDLQTGDTVVIVDKTSERAMTNNNGDSSPSAVEIELSGDQNALTEVPDATLKWVVVLNNGNYQFRKPGTDNEYLYCLDFSNGVRVGGSSANQFTFENGGTYSVPFLKNTSNSHYIGLNESNEWRSPTSISSASTIKNTVIGFYVRPAAVPPTPHTVRFASGNDGWTVTDVDSARSATAPAVLQNVMAGDSLVVTAPASLPGKVKSVKAVKYVPPAATVTTDPTATEAYIEVGSTAALVNAGAANGGTMMYAVTTTDVQPASTADFSATIPTAEGLTAGTYYVWYYAKADADHSDSEIAGPVSDTLAVMTTVTWDNTNVFNGGHWQDGLDENHTTPLTYEGITISLSVTDGSFFNAFIDYAQTGLLVCYGDEGDDTFTFTAPQGKKFCKIEIINNGGITFTNYGDWRQINNNIVWSGTAANTVTLGTVYASAGSLTSIVFKLIDAQ